MKLFNLLFALLFSISAFCQNLEIQTGGTASDTSYTVMYRKLKELYIIKKNSSSQINAMSLQKEFLNRSNVLKEKKRE